ncbi:MAG TPA: formylglycine-generating enzyme family protein, partial [Devosia sp.]|nr:formylglycine-generating enzyme family protein [Devosia sp.]
VWGDGHGNEQPVHWVEMPEFQLARTVVTQGMWERVMGDNPAEGYGEEFIGADKPIVGVSWEDAQAFIHRLNAMVPEGQYRLPGEAEWEYAARSGGQRHKWPGTSKESELERYAWFEKNSGYAIHPVAQKQPNELGLYDMAGNVFEWCQDRWHDSYEGAPGDGSAWQSGGSRFRVLRGGSWSSPPSWLRSAFRDELFLDSIGLTHRGFRLARVPY